MGAVSGRIKTLLTRDNILRRANEYDIYRFYLGQDLKIGRAIHSPFRDENNPSFSINVSKDGSILHVDYGDSEKRGDCVEFVMQLFNLTFRDALNRIDSDMQLGITNKKGTQFVKAEAPIGFIHKEPPAFIQVITKAFTVEELEYWKMFEINLDDLVKENVFSVKKAFLNRQRMPLPSNELVFAYLQLDKWKIYRPFARYKKDKFRSNIPNDWMSGLDKIVPGSPISLVTKSKKDEILLSKIIPATCSVQSENVVAISSENIQILKKNSILQYVNFDSDETGVQACKYYNQFGFKWINCPKGYYKPDSTMIKDFSDLCRYAGFQKVVDYFKSKGLI